MELANRFFTPVILFLLTLAFGYWLSRVGKPYNGTLFNIHKLIALAGVVFAVIQVSKMIKAVDFPAFFIALLVLAAVCVIALFASGALLSLGKLGHVLTLTIHRTALAILVTAAALAYFLLTR